MPILPDIAFNARELQTLDQLNQIQDLLNAYVIKNMLLVGSSSQSQVVLFINPNLYRLAISYYGDANLWTTIASANNLTDPNFIGTISLLIPPPPTVPSGGILTPPTS